ncbi:imelysin family protein [Terasakiella sp. A23]|uniref:imelysin family protein n=1 Tax=Terasakiella sp. FCG-A23 TaxID=3080561 RepID=UPI002953BA75|nr:imelysin family protein [Terasakiella sp. A23]MDV7340242.1 imelysin family protein [Terasakiella sp. A23]
MKVFNFLKTTAAAAVILAAASTAQAGAPNTQDIVKNYSDIALAMYQDSLSEAQKLKSAISALVANPSDTTLKAAREAWVAARVPYQQTEGFRFGNAIVDDWEGKVNAWPLDEGLIDYVDASYGKASDENPAYTLNVIANKKVRIGPDMIDATNITPALLSGSLHEAQEVEANVATGYHAIEFMLWGQDLNGTNAGAGNRPTTDFDTKNCTNGNCDRRVQFLTAATDLLITDLEEIVGAWSADGAARKDIAGKSENDALATILTGLGSLSYGELAGERMKLGVILHDPEEEHDCFSDNTHNSHYYNQVGMNAIYTGSYTRVDGSVVSGASVGDLAQSKAPEAHSRLSTLLGTTNAKMQIMKDTADSGKMAYDQMLGEGNKAGNKILLDVVDGLVAQTRGIENVVSKLGLKIEVEGSDSLDNPTAIN